MWPGTRRPGTECCGYGNKADLTAVTSPAPAMFSAPSDPRTADYVEGRFG